MATEIIEYKITRQDDGEFLDQGGCSWSSLESWFFIDILGGCGCGTSEELGKKAIRLFRALGHEPRDYNQFAITYNDEVFELFLHWFDSCKLTEHGSSVFGSWLTDQGKAVHKALIEVDKLST